MLYSSVIACFTVMQLCVLSKRSQSSCLQKWSEKHILCYIKDNCIHRPNDCVIEELIGIIIGCSPVHLEVWFIYKCRQLFVENRTYCTSCHSSEAKAKWLSAILISSQHFCQEFTSCPQCSGLFLYITWKKTSSCNKNRLFFCPSYDPNCYLIHLNRSVPNLFSSSCIAPPH